MDRALEDVKVLDLTHVQAGPSCGQMLGFLGADVVKIEDTRGGDSTRWELAHRDDSDSFYFLIFNNNKRAITLDLKTEKGKEVFKGLVKWADVIRQSFKQGAVDDIITTRRLIDITKTFSIFRDKMKSIVLCLERFDDETRESFVDFYTKVDAGVSMDDLLNTEPESFEEEDKDEEDNVPF